MKTEETLDMKMKDLSGGLLARTLAAFGDLPEHLSIASLEHHHAIDITHGII